jgi:hypothetical protein
LEGREGNAFPLVGVAVPDTPPSAGSSPQRPPVMLRNYVVNATAEAFGQAIGPLREMVGDAMPSITTIGVQALYKPEILVEIEMAVRLP